MTSAKVYQMNHSRQTPEDPLNLQSLPMASPPRDGWPAIEAELRRDRRRRGAMRYASAALAAAASVTLLLALVLQQPAGVPTESAAGDRLVRTIETGAAPSGAAKSEASQPSAKTLGALIALSQRLEGRLRSIRSGVGDLPASSVVYRIELEDLVAQVDEELSSRPDSLPLWSQRVNLLMDLERLYENSLRREYQQMASL
jgi:hypothetical protein